MQKRLRASPKAGGSLLHAITGLNRRQVSFILLSTTILLTLIAILSENREVVKMALALFVGYFFSALPDYVE
jgi:hypothetical protein